MPQAKKLIIFFVPPEKIVNGGILSIFSICKVSRELKINHDAKVVLSTYPGTKSYKKNDLFENDELVYEFDELVKDGVPDSLQLHVPEYASLNTFLALKKYRDYITAIPHLSVNLMTQNIMLIQPPEHTANWFSLTPYVTQTMAHDKYTTQEIANDYDTPTHLFSTYIDANQFDPTPFEKKEKLILLSPDLIPERKAVAASLKEKFPDYTIQTIQNLTYEQYKEVMGRAKFAITFGEGFDGYYAGGYFSNTVVFAVYNESFFPSKDFKSFKNTYDSNADMLKNIASDIEKFNNKKVFDAIVKANLDVINVFCSYENYVKNVEKFYQGEYTHTPEKYSAEKLIGRVVKDSEKTIAEHLAKIKELSVAVTGMERMIAEKTEDIHGLEAKLKGIENSVSWKVTKPLRQASSKIKR